MNSAGDGMQIFYRFFNINGHNRRIDIMNLPILTIVTVSIQPIEEFFKTAESIRQQHVDPHTFEWVIVVGNYYDEYRQYLDSIQGALNIKLYYEVPSGIYAAMNFGLDKAQGTWVWFVNCGDYLKDSKVIEFVLGNLRDKTNINLLASPVLYSTPQGYWFDVSHPSFTINEDSVQAHVHHQGAIARTESCKLIARGFDVELKYAADGKLLDSITTKSNYIIVDRILVVFTMGGASSKNFRKTLLETQSYRMGSTCSLVLVLKNRIREILVSDFAWRVLPSLIKKLLNPRDKQLKLLYPNED